MLYISNLIDFSGQTCRRIGKIDCDAFNEMMIDCDTII